MKKRRLIHKHKSPPNSREVIIDHKTTIITTSTKSDEEVRKAYLEKLAESLPKYLRKKKP